jgi:hypothetical protein
MRKDLDEALVHDFPNLYRDRCGDKNVTCMYWGFDVGDGWEPIIRNLSERLEIIILSLAEEIRPQYAAFQVKEKFGVLRYYLINSTAEMDEAISDAVNLTAETCETCGQPGKLVTRMNWLRTTCKKCDEARSTRSP